MKNNAQIYFLQVLYKIVGYKKRGKTMNIQPINNTMTRNTINNQISFKDLEDDFEFKIKTPYQCAMEKLDRKFEELVTFEKSAFFSSIAFANSSFEQAVSSTTSCNKPAHIVAGPHCKDAKKAWFGGQKRQNRRWR